MRSAAHSTGSWKRLKVYLRHFSFLKYLFRVCCKRSKKLKRKLKRIKNIQEVVKDKFDVRKMIIDIASLIYN